MEREEEGWHREFLRVSFVVREVGNGCLGEGRWGRSGDGIFADEAVAAVAEEKTVLSEIKALSKKPFQAQAGAGGRGRTSFSGTERMHEDHHCISYFTVSGQRLKTVS